MDALASKVRLAALWILSAVALFAYRTLALSENATEVSMLINEDFATYLLVMMFFAFLSLVLPLRINRLTNLIAGTIVGVAQTAMLADGLVGYPSATFNLLTGATLVNSGAIIWLAYRWHQPTFEETTTEATRHSQRDRTAAGV